MSVVYQNNFETGDVTNWVGSITDAFSVSPTHSITNRVLSLLMQGNNPDIATIAMNARCENGGATASLRYYDQANVAHVIETVPCDSNWHAYNLTVNDYVKKVGLFNAPGFDTDKYIDDLVLSDATIPPADTSIDYSASTSAAIISGSQAIFSPFYQNIGLIMLAIGAVAVGLMVVNWIKSNFGSR